MIKQITLAIHTYRYAVELKRRLADAGIEATLQNIAPDNPEIYPGVRVRIPLEQLSKALRIVETAADNSMSATAMKLNGIDDKLLIPVDFSDNSNLAIEVGFDLAQRLDLHPVLLNAFITSYFSGVINVNSNIENVDTLPNAEPDITLDKEARGLMEQLKNRINKRMSEGTLPNLKFSCEIREGIPEEVILQYSRVTPPAFIIMATRSADRRSEELVGSVTAEVLDSTRVPLFIVPENHKPPRIKDIDRVIFFCNLEQHDILTMDFFQRIFSYPSPEIILVPVNERAGDAVKSRIATLEEYFRNNYPSTHFTSYVLELKSFRAQFEQLVLSKDIQLIVVPNKRRNIFTRLFNPSIAHKILFEKDIPMIVLPT